MNCWSIIENRPINVEICPTWTCRFFLIKIPAMTMRYETFCKLGDTLSLESIDNGMKEGRIYSPEKVKFANDVSCASYNYSNGECEFCAPSMTDINNWLELNKEVVKHEK